MMALRSRFQAVGYEIKRVVAGQVIDENTGDADPAVVIEMVVVLRRRQENMGWLRPIGWLAWVAAAVAVMVVSYNGWR